MVDITNGALTKYYNILAKTGYRSYCVVDYLMILGFLQELSGDNYKGFIKESDIMCINRLLSIISDKLCEYHIKKQVDNSTFRSSHWIWHDSDIWKSDDLYMVQPSSCGCSKSSGSRIKCSDYMNY